MCVHILTCSIFLTSFPYSRFDIFHIYFPRTAAEHAEAVEEMENETNHTHAEDIFLERENKATATFSNFHRSTQFIYDY